MKTFCKKSTPIMLIFFFMILAFGLIGSNRALAVATAPSLGTATDFSVLAKSTMTAANPTTISGYLGLSTGLAVTGTWLPIGHTEYLGPTTLAATARANALSASGILAGQDSDGALGAWGGDTSKLPGVYTEASDTTFTGTLTLTGGYDDVWVFQIGGDMTFSGSVIMGGNAQPCNVFWQVGNDATIAAGSSFKGTLIAGNNITVVSGATVDGRVLSLNGALTTDNNSITGPTCLAAPVIGVCGTAVKTYPYTAINFGSDTFCSAGTSPSPSPTFPTAGNSVTWTCAGINDGASSGNCIAAVSSAPPTPVNGVCGTANKIYAYNAGSFGSDTLCSAGTASITPTFPTAGNSVTWTCAGINDGNPSGTCTATVNSAPPTLVVNKSIINDNGGTKLFTTDFSFMLDGIPVAHGAVNTTTVGLHTVSETADPGYATTYGGNCAEDGTITLALGDVMTCTIINDDIAPASHGNSWRAPLVPPLIDVVKVPSRLALPDGPGAVKYTYTLRNIGTVPVTSLTMVGDTCSPITLISGDTNADAKLDVNETWVYTCSTALTATHTNIVTATGYANGISATDIASATVIVGVPVVPPLIHVTKVPSTFVLSAGGGMVTYTNKVTNPGTVALSNVILTDDKCDPVKYISGDANGNSKLDTTETWVYTCRTELTKTTVNTISASGEANGLTARDFAIVTVVVNAAVPKLPNTGLPLGGNSIPWNIIVPVGIVAILASFYFVRRKYTV